MTGPIVRAADPTQLTIAHIRARVLGGRGLDTEPGERARAQRDRDLLGALPAPLERELVALTSDLIRSTPDGPILDRLRPRFERLCAHWQPPGTPPPRARLAPAWIR
ncbi:hypothetical protein NLM24_00350 [Nocardia zapadnayensis]|uniref:hypothetical protein n=1 Tax=Nocardia rhamnosiphila TaxID=426716 RepID=UPI0022470829|nr:hypothetical protein [Nocardia zapadnayensis]MCX0269190.1 hypothetical protein [Nocardia zapadnayensis]